jgi:hypothetical protein
MLRGLVAAATSWPPSTPAGFAARPASASPAGTSTPEVDLEEVRDRIYALTA